ncbi:hypothetical protein TEA_023912 [Camellia sinensis var. sinensis]|uniref:TPX2 C-terminal domain-containing protein n=1 Tax=Camellia sinensis var. sinensis TaxID=542762 RepID=A0A4S4ECZ5_CAMSN|nr:hypothetical protein TEA_023912 [Camellia sinensis var. sinensis]
MTQSTIHHTGPKKNPFTTLEKGRDRERMAAIHRAIRSIQTGVECPRLSRFSLHAPKSAEVEFSNGNVYNLSAEFLRTHSPAADSKARSVGGEKVTVKQFFMLELLSNLNFPWYIYLGDIWAASCGDHVCRTHRELWGKGNPMHTLGDSISFGRFMSESLSWEKWSTFSHKRYVEEAERYAQPGSVAQKKAFFEAHYKSIAAKKAAALLEQANANAANNHPDPEFETHDSQSTIEPVVDEQLELKAPVDTIVNGNGYNSNVELEIGEVKVADTVVTGHEVQNESLKQSMVSEMDIGESPQMEKPLLEGLKSNHELGESLKQSMVSEMDLGESPQMEKPLLEGLKSNHMVSEMELGESPQMKKPLLEGLKSNHEVPSLINKKKKQEISSSKSVVSITPLTRKSTIESMDKNRSTSNSLKKLIYSTSAKESDNKSAAPEFSSTKPAVHQRVPKVLASPAKTVAPVLPKTATRKSTTDDSMDRKRATPRSLKELIYSSPDKESEPAATGRRIESSRVAPSPYKASKDCKTPLRTPIVSPTLSTPFSLRTEERAARRKQASLVASVKLEEKFNAKDTQKVQLQTRLKEKAGTELRKLRQSFCFKARPLPDFYKERETPKDQINKTPSTHPQPPKLGKRKPSSSSSTLQGGITSLPPVTASTKKSCSKNVFKTKSHRQIPNPKMMTNPHENTSPNIQH